MNIIGTFKATETGYTGTIQTLAIHVPVTIDAVEKRSENAPGFQVYSRGAHIGAGWHQTSEEGVEYVRLSIDDASLPETIYASLFTNPREPGAFQLIWNRSRKQAA